MTEQVFYIVEIICGILFVSTLIVAAASKKRGVLFFFSCIGLVVSLVIAVAALFATFPPKSKDNNPPLTSGSVSDTLVFDELEITVTDYVFSDSCGNLESLTKAKEGNVWCTVYFDAKNISKETKVISDSFSTKYTVELVYKDGYTYNSAWQDYSEFFNAHDTIAPLTTLNRVCVSYEVPSEIAENNDSLVLKFCRNSRKETDFAEWKLR